MIIEKRPYHWTVKYTILLCYSLGILCCVVSCLLAILNNIIDIYLRLGTVIFNLFLIWKFIYHNQQFHFYYIELIPINKLHQKFP